MTDTHIAKLMWDAYAIQAGGKTFDGKPLPTWDELGEDRQSCWIAAASVAASRIEKLEHALNDCILVFGVTQDTSFWKAYEDVINKARKALEGKDD